MQIKNPKNDSSGNFNNSMDIQTEHETGSVGSLRLILKIFLQNQVNRPQQIHLKSMMMKIQNL